MDFTMDEYLNCSRNISQLYFDNKITHETYELTTLITEKIHPHIKKTTPTKKILTLLTSFWIAYKFYETNPGLFASTLQSITQHKIHKNTFIQLEIEILKFINFKLINIYSSTKHIISSFI